MNSVHEKEITPHKAASEVGIHTIITSGIPLKAPNRYHRQAAVKLLCVLGLVSSANNINVIHQAELPWVSGNISGLSILSSKRTQVKILGLTPIFCRTSGDSLTSSFLTVISVKEERILTHLPQRQTKD